MFIFYVIGFTDGSFNVYDVRLPSGQNEIINQRDFSTSVIGSSILSNNQRLVVGSQDGDIRVWEPRMYCVSCSSVFIIIIYKTIISELFFHQLY